MATAAPRGARAPRAAARRPRGAAARRRAARPRRAAAAAAAAAAQEAARADDVLPDDLYDACEQAADAAAAAYAAGAPQAIVELLVPELFDPLSGALMESEGDQMRLWSLSRGVLELVARRMELIGGEGEGGDADGEGVESAGHRVVAVYPDSGVGAMLQNRWAGAPYRFASVDDRVNSVVRPETELVVVCIPDPPSIRKVIAIAEAAQEAGAQLLLFNPRLASGDIGVGLALRDTFRDFTLQMQVAYSIRPVGDGSVYKCYPAPWKVFLGDPEEEGRYILAAEQNTRPNSEEIFNLMDALDDGTLGKEDDEDTDGGDGNAGGLFGAARKGIREAQKFARDISRL